LKKGGNLPQCHNEGKKKRLKMREPTEEEDLRSRVKKNDSAKKKKTGEDARGSGTT